jgi:hypothetical protein
MQVYTDSARHCLVDLPIPGIDHFPHLPLSLLVSVLVPHVLCVVHPLGASGT